MTGTKSDRQRNALHLYCERVAEALNDSGWEMKKFLSRKPEIEIPWSKTSVKECIWRPVQVAMIDKKSTEDLDKLEPSEIYEVVNRHLSEYGIHVEWPSKEML